ncbi:hypothetical protein LF95_23675 [Thalassospira sp. TSL5-1]|nr:hypothetical protein LF95_23675 [Thalassospira sp. TSL5-1]
MRGINTTIELTLMVWCVLVAVGSESDREKTGDLTGIRHDLMDKTTLADLGAGLKNKRIWMVF